MKFQIGANNWLQKKLVGGKKLPLNYFDADAQTVASRFAEKQLADDIRRTDTWLFKFGRFGWETFVQQTFDRLTFDRRHFVDLMFARYSYEPVKTSVVSPHFCRPSVSRSKGFRRNDEEQLKLGSKGQTRQKKRPWEWSGFSQLKDAVKMSTW
jgi:hypothetical protein